MIPEEECRVIDLCEWLKAQYGHLVHSTRAWQELANYRQEKLAEVQNENDALRAELMRVSRLKITEATLMETEREN